jgi:two-component system chemotaxis response regulator CheB
MTDSHTPAAVQPIRIMIVDDSAAARRFIARQLEPEPLFAIVGTAANGKEALEFAPDLAPDVILLDIAMPEMDGLTALPSLLPRVPNAKVLILSGVTNRYAELGVNALHIGASDILEKPTASDANAVANFTRELHYKIKVLGGRSAQSEVMRPTTLLPSPAKATPTTLRKQYPKALALAASTGGPQALLELFAHLHDTTLRVPIFITQHMPVTFTAIFAENLHKASTMPCGEAVHGAAVEAGHIYVAPGDHHMRVARHNGQVQLLLNQDPPEHFCRPAADPMIRSLIEIYGDALLLCVLSGMGEDGLDGARKLAAAGGQILVQERESCAVWGMPKVVSEAGLGHHSLSLVDMSRYIREVCS